MASSTDPGAQPLEHGRAAAAPATLLPGDTLLTRLLRRCYTISMILLAFLLLSLLFPGLGLVALLVDAYRRLRRGIPETALRLLTFSWLFLWSELVGIVLLLLGRVWSIGRPVLLIELTTRTQIWWTSFLLSAIEQLFHVQFRVEGDEVVKPGPLLVFIRHASIIDTLLPSVFLTKRHGIRLRFVMKRELLADPCIDIAGHWLANYFVSRGRGSGQQEVAAIRRLAQHLGPEDAVLIYPEGTRFTQARQAQALEHIKKSSPELLRRAQAFTHVLPPRLGGPLALLETEGDVLFFAHHGFEKLTHFKDMWSGGLSHRVVRIKFWRVPRSEIPSSEAARTDWLYRQWDRMNQWVANA